MGERPVGGAPAPQRFRILTQDRPAEIAYTPDMGWSVSLHDGGDLLTITEGMLRAVTDPRTRQAIDEIIEHEWGQPAPHALIRDLDHG